ncbi:LacI family DNA-binding transcriptional regulator [Phyllobacterium endophyticum]|uniref:LacI family transcriptional regulator n=1 Tax=Phyllobacterium endophyticum TaxID=1149773 RepID=A0A2P7AS43_9HYPH|nr:LacI family DNA-binding transcriptional regulator [Phyllobacterium endophyticum]MBB3236768.1 LacI family transcriptional regulator [Phyllobacterium endophyticum]PSH57044.1 LacI family transcriptional regulator [Phyllobacterium endophyticum]TYR40323.1 LacI family transcriptional regulator [Phyllobacterium endophyticum]
MSRINLSERVTIYDVAAAAGVSTATASKALNDTGRMSAETRDRIRRVARELGFRPNALARSLTRKRSFTVGLLTDDTYGRFTLPVMAGISEGLIDHGVSVFLCAVEDNPALAKVHVDAMLDKQVDGIIATGKRIDKPLPVDLSHLSVPVVYALTAAPLEAVTFVPDDRQGAQEAVDHLIAAGRTKIVHITGPGSFRVVQERASAFAETMQSAGLPVSQAAILQGTWSERWGHEAVEALWSGENHPDGIFCGNDQIARGVIDALRERTIEVPTDVSVVGFDNWEIVAEQTRPPLTTVDMNLKELGRQAGQALVRLVNGETVEQGLWKLPCMLVVRGS